MFIRKTFQTFLVAESTDAPPVSNRDWEIDWRWFQD